MNGDIVNLDLERARRRPPVDVPPVIGMWVALGACCFWPASLMLSAAFCAYDSICARWGDPW